MSIVVVIYGVFMKFLIEDEIIDLLKVGWKDYYVGEVDKFDGKGKRIVFVFVFFVEDFWLFFELVEF